MVDLQKISFVLVDPENDSNIGAAARAMNTMGYSDLRLVRPKADPLSGKAKALAHGSEQILETAKIYDDLASALEGTDFSCATTTRHRLQKYTYLSVRELPQHLNGKADSVKSVALVFGGETSGLSRGDLEHCDLLTTIPQYRPQPSLNLAQAVMVYCFALSEVQTLIQTEDYRINSQEMPLLEYANLKSSSLRLMERIGLSKRNQDYVIKGLARLGYEDLYLLHNIRSSIDRLLDKLEVKSG
ncbi:TrmH family RNA methyltransferase [Acaryochloris thomasi]|nr:TrmH family RNA methyltransferase [Acaryochloris thomasi]